MGRKIPGKKHRGVKDPEKQRRNRLRSIADKIDAPPRDPDEQNVSHSLKRIMELKELVKAPKKQVRKKPPPKYIQRPGETDRSFLHRIHLDCETIMKEKAFEDKYKVTIKKDPVTGKVQEVVKADKDELLEYAKQMKKQQNCKSKKSKKKITEKQPKLSKGQKRRAKLLAKKEQKESENKIYDFQDKKDYVQFGEVVHAPPVLSAPRHAENITRKPGNKDLLMKSMLNSGNTTITNNSNKKNEIERSKKKVTKVPKVTKVIDKKSKRKLLPVGLRRQLERDQKQIIDAYRQLKADKIKKSR